MARRQYTQAEKLAYYKRKANAQSRPIRGQGAYYAPPRMYSRPIRGRGAYKAPKSAEVGRKIAEAVAGVTPLAPISGLLGKAGGWIGDKIGTVFGLGAYSVMRNSLLVPEGMDPPNMHESSGDTIITHREYIRDIVSSATPGQFQLESFDINPGLISTFPWLSGIASAYEEYEMLGLIFEFKTLSSDALNSTNTALGYVAMATNYNAASDAFLNKQSMLNTQYSNDTKPSCSALHPIECDPHKTPQYQLYVRGAAVPAGQDQKTYDLGKFQIATGGMQAASVLVGELWATYQVRLRKPLFGPQLGVNLLSDHYYNTGVSASAEFGTAMTLRSGSSIRGDLTATTYTFPDWISSGNFFILYRAQGISITLGTNPSFSVTQGELLDSWVNGTGAQAGAPSGGANTTAFMIAAIVKVDAPGVSRCVVTLDGAAGYFTAGECDFFVTAFNNTIEN